MLRRAAEPLAFLSLATALHAAVWIGLPGGGREGSAPAGGDGAGAVTLAASPALTARVAEWRQAPAVAQAAPVVAAPGPVAAAMPRRPQADAPPVLASPAVPPVATAPDRPLAPVPDPSVLLPAPATPVMAPTALSIPSPASPSAPPAPRADGPAHRPAPGALAAPAPGAPPAPETAPAEQPPPRIVAQTAPPGQTRPAPRPNPRPDPRPAPPPAPAALAAGQGAAPVAGARGSQVAAPGAGSAGAGALSAGQRAALLADWAGAIRARVERRKAYPRAARASGTVLLRLTVAADGTLLASGVAEASGHAALDRAALDALSRAGRLPAAPAGFDRARQVFTLPLRFAP